MASAAAASSLSREPLLQFRANASFPGDAVPHDPARIRPQSLQSSFFKPRSSSTSPTLMPSIQTSPFSIKQRAGLKLGSVRRTTNLCISARIKEHTGTILGAESLRFAVVAGRFNEVITKLLVAGALETFKRFAVKDEHIDVVWVPGSFEIPVIAQTIASSGKYNAVVCIGAVVRGSTTHYEAVANSAASGIMSASLNSGVPCIFGVLTCETMEQAIDRAGGKVGNKGGEAALSAIEMASLIQHVREIPKSSYD